MTKAIGAAAVALTICTASTLACAPMQNVSGQTGLLDSRIGPAIPQRYESIRDAKDWENPYLVVRRDGIDVIVSPGRQTIFSTDIQRTLIELPVAAWPYGRVVAVSDMGIGAPNGADDQPISENREAALAILKALQVTVERWPS